MRRDYKLLNIRNPQIIIYIENIKMYQKPQEGRQCGRASQIFTYQTYKFLEKPWVKHWEQPYGQFYSITCLRCKYAHEAMGIPLQPDIEADNSCFDKVRIFFFNLVTQSFKVNLEKLIQSTWTHPTSSRNSKEFIPKVTHCWRLNGQCF